MNPQETAIQAIKRKPYKIAQEVGFPDVREYPHNAWMVSVIDGKGDYTLLAHRGSYKSSIMSVCIALMMVVYPDKNIIFLRKADNDVAEMITMVEKALNSDVIQSIAMVLYRRRLTLAQSNASSITTNLYMSASGASQLLGIGLKSSITGKHADLVITDDICNISDRISRAERERTKTQYQELQNIRNRGGRIINTGTKWHQNDVFSLIDDIEVCDYKSTGLITEEQAKSLKKRMTPSLWACNYELRIIPSDDVIFTDPQTGADISMVMQGQCHVDAAYYGEDYTAFTAMNVHDGKRYVYGRMWRKHVEDVTPQIVAEIERLKLGRMYMETNADKGYAAKAFREKGVRVQTYHEKMNKFLKVTTYLKTAWPDVIFCEGTDEAYVNQICDFTEDAEHDDSADSLSSLCRVMKADSKPYVSPFR